MSHQVRTQLRIKLVLGLVLLAAGTSSAYHVPWQDFTVQSGLSAPTAITAVDLDGSGVLEVVVLGEEFPAYMAVLTSVGDGTFTSTTPFTFDEFDASTPRQAQLTALDTYGPAAGRIVIAGTPSGGSSPFYRVYDISAIGALTELAEVEMTWLASGTVGEARCVADIGDLDGNGTNDLALGFPDDNRVEIVFLNASFAVTGHQTIKQGVGGFEGNLRVDGEFVVVTIEPGDDLGWSVARIDDYAPGAPDSDVANLAIGIPGRLNDSGMVSLVSLATDGTVAWDRGWYGPALGTVSMKKGSAVTEPAEAGSRFGASVTAIPEFNFDYGDSLSTPAQGDLLIGMPGLDEAGLHPDPDPTADPRIDRGGFVMVDILVNGGVNTNNWMVVGDRSGGVCRSLPDGAGLGLDAVVIGDVFGNGEDDYLVLGSLLDATEFETWELMLLNMEDAYLWHWHHSAADNWEPTVGPEFPEEIYAVIGLTNGASTPDMTGLDVAPSIEAFKIGSCFDDDPVVVKAGYHCSDVLTITGNAKIETGGVLEVVNDLTVDGTLTNNGTILTKGCDDGRSAFYGSGEIQLTSAGSLILDSYLTWNLVDADNFGLISGNPDRTDQRFLVDFNTTFFNYGTVELSNLDYTGTSSGFEANQFENHGMFIVDAGGVHFDINKEHSAPSGDLINYGTCDLKITNSTTPAYMFFQSMRPVNHGTIKLSVGDGITDANDYIQTNVGLENHGIIEMVDDVLFNVNGDAIRPIIWNGGSITGTGTFQWHAPTDVNADWTIADGILFEALNTNTMTIADGVTLQIEGNMRTVGGSYTYSPYLITGPGSFRIEVAGELLIDTPQTGIRDGVLQVSTGAFECAGRILMRETGPLHGDVFLNPINGMLIEPGGELIMDAPNVGGTPRRYLEGAFTNHGTIRVDLPVDGTTEWKWPWYSPPPGGTYDNQIGGLIEIHSPVNGIWAGSTLQNAGTVAFHDDGEFVYNGDFVQSADGLLLVELNADSPAAGPLRPTGIAQFEGGIELQTALDFVPTASSTRTLAGYGSVTTHTFGAETYPEDGIGYQLTYDVDELLVNLSVYTMLTYDSSAGSLVDLDPVSGKTRLTTPKKALPTGSDARLASSRDGNHLYALIDPGPTASLLSIDPETLTGSTPFSFPASSVASLHSIVVDRPGGVLVAFDGTTTPNLLGRVQRVDLEAGSPVLSGIRTVTFSPPTPGASLDLMAVSRDGQLYGMSDLGAGTRRLWAIDGSTGDAVVSADITYGAGVLDGLSFLGDELWASCSAAGEAIRIVPGGGSSPDTTVTLPTTGLSGLAIRRVVGADPEIRTRSALAGGTILVDESPGFSAPSGDRFDLYRGTSPADLAYGAPVFVDSSSVFDFADTTAEDFTTYFYRVDVITDVPGKVETLTARLFSGAAIARPRLWISELAPSGGVAKVGEKIEIRNLAPQSIDLTGYRISNGTAEETLTGIVTADGYFVHTVAAIDLPDAGGTLSLLAPGSDFVFDSVGWGTEGGAPAVPSGFTISRVPGTDPDDSDAKSFETGAPTMGSPNQVAEPMLGSSIVINEVSFLGDENQDYIEIINPLGSAVVLDDFAVSDGSGFLQYITSGLQLEPGEIHLLDAGATDPFVHDLISTTLYLYQVVEGDLLQRIDQLGWGGSIADFAPPTPVSPNTAVVRDPDGNPLYLGEQAANWLESGGDVGMFFGPPTPGLPNIGPGGVSLTVDPLGGGDFTSIAGALGAAAPGTSILIEPGDYAESLTLVDGVRVIGMSTGGTDVRILGDGIGPAIVASGVGATAQISQVVVKSGAGGLEVTGASPVCRNVTFLDNRTTGDGGGVWIDGGSPNFIGCVFDGNSAAGNGGAVQVLSGTPHFDSCLFVYNTADADGGVVHDAGGSSTFEHCVMDRNGSPTGILFAAGGSITATYTILTNSTQGAAMRAPSGGVGFSCGVVYNHPNGPSGEPGIVTADILEVDPMYCQPGLRNYSYAEPSPVLALNIACGATVGIAGPPCNIPSAVEIPVAVRSRMLPPAPNPFNPATSLRFDLERPADVTLEIFNLRGRLVAQPVQNQRFEAGRQSVMWHGKNLQARPVASGVYIARMRLDGKPTGDSVRLVLLK